MELARLVGALEERKVIAGELITREGDPADALYLLESGRIRLTIRSVDGEVEVGELDAPAHFGELGLLLDRRSATARAATDARLWRLPRARFEELAREDATLAMRVARGLAELLDRRQRVLIGAPIAEEEVRQESPPPAVARPSSRAVGGLVATFVVPALLWNVTPPGGLEVGGWHALLLLLGASIAWLSEPVPDFVVAIGLVAAYAALGLAPLETTFGGFATTTWVLALASLAVAAAMSRTGLLFRAALGALRLFPPTHVGQVVGLVVGGLAVTPLVPLSVARVAAIARVTRELAQALGHAPRSNGSAAVAFAGLVGYWYFSNVFLSGFATNLFVRELLPANESFFASWAGWLVAAIPAGIVLIVGSLIALLVLFRPEREARIRDETLQRQNVVLGAPRRPELVAATALVLLIAGLALPSSVGGGPAVFALAAIVVAFAGGLDRAGFRTGIDWGVLVLFGLFIGTAAVLRDTGVDRWIGGLLVGASGIGPALTVLAIAIVVMASRFLLPSRPAILLFAVALVPAAPAAGISGWVAGFVVLLAANVWVLPYQGLEYLVLRDGTRGESFDDRQGTRLGVALAVVRLVAIAASIPYWMALGLVR